MSTLFVTGGAGFIGSTFIRYWLDLHPNDSVINFDLLTYAGNPASLSDVVEKYGSHYSFVKGDIGNSDLVYHLFQECRPDFVINFAAESHNSRAIKDPASFYRTNVLGTQILLDAARRAGIRRFHHISTCEVYGDLDLESSNAFMETSPLRPRTPYNASKAGADLAVRAYYETFHLPITISNCSNNYGPYQFPEKVIPSFTIKAVRGEPLPLYKSSHFRREWLHVQDHCRAIERILEAGVVGETYNVGSGVEADVETIADAILKRLGRPASQKAYVPDRPGHDRRYLLDCTKIRTTLSWTPTVPFDQGLQETIDWYVAHPQWWEPLLPRLQSLSEDKWTEEVTHEHGRANSLAKSSIHG